MLRGLSTVNMFAADVQAATDWYAEVLGTQPYFQRDLDGRPVYVEFRIGDYLHELGILDSRFASHPVGSPGGPMTYWAVDDVQASLQRMLELGASLHQEPREHGPGFVTASVVDPDLQLRGQLTRRQAAARLQQEQS